MSPRPGLPRPRRHHPDAPRCHRGDDGCAGHGRQRLLAAHRRARRPAPDGGVARDARRAAWVPGPSEVIFTAGGTESDNLAVKGIYWARRDADPRRRRIVTTAVEHHAVLDAVSWLAEHEGAEVTWLPIERRRLGDTGRAARRAATSTTTSPWCRSCGPTTRSAPSCRSPNWPPSPPSSTCPMHSDAVQAVGQIPVRLRRQRAVGDERDRPQVRRTDRGGRAAAAPRHRRACRCCTAAVRNATCVPAHRMSPVWWRWRRRPSIAVESLDVDRRAAARRCATG